MNKIIFTLFIFSCIPAQVCSQDIYKTPSGEKYHLTSCRMVENVSKKLLKTSDIVKYNLAPCKICKPPIKSQLNFKSNPENKAVGESLSVRCNGYTKARTRCKHKTRLANGYCYQHTKQNSGTNLILKSAKIGSKNSTCGAKTKSGGNCKRMVKGGGRCYQH